MAIEHLKKGKLYQIIFYKDMTWSRSFDIYLEPGLAAQVNSESSQTSKTERFTEAFNGLTGF